MINSIVEPSRPAHEVRLVLISVASFLLYALGVLTLHQDRAAGWSLEAEGPLPVAASHLVYGAPLGAMDDNVMRAFLPPEGAAVQDVQGTLSIVAKGLIPRGPVDPYSFDGGGAGENLFATAAMWMFGINITSLVLLYLAIVGSSALAFTLRYRDKRLIVVPLYFLVATVILLTPLCSSASAINQMPIGGQRYFVLAGFLPAIHIFFEITDRSNVGERKTRILVWLPLLIQSLFLFGALLVRSSTGYLLGVLLVTVIWRFFEVRKQKDRLVSLVSRTAIVGAALLFWATFIIVMMPAYAHTGRVLGNFWHRSFVSFSIHPEWPFGNLREVYDCTQFIPEGLNQAHTDRNGHCIWWLYPPNAQNPNEAMLGVYGGEYERALRNAYFYVILHYPKQAFELYFYIKSRLIKDDLIAAWGFLFGITHAPVANGLFVVAAAQFLLFILFIISMETTDLNIIDSQLMIFPIFFIFSLAPLYVAWANLWTATDTVFLMYVCMVLAAMVPLQFVTKIIAYGALTESARTLSKLAAPKQDLP